MKFAIIGSVLSLLSVTTVDARVLPRAQCASTLSIAKDRITRLQSHWFNSVTGQYQDGSLWTDTNGVEDIHNWMLGAGSTQFDSLGSQCYICRIALSNASKDTWNSVLAGSNDDALWIVLAMWKIADYNSAHAKNTAPYMNAASIIYDIVAAEWDTSKCGGGVWWSKAHTYKNAITNELFLLTSASGYIRTGKSNYLDNANKVYTWLVNSGMRNGDHLWNDGLTDGCANNGQTTWTYNQGVIASGLAALYVARGRKDTSLLDYAEQTLDAVISKLTVNNILKESCDDPKNSGCNHDQQIFKGIWAKHVQYYLDMANDSKRTAKYAPFLGSLNSAVYHYGTNADGDIGNVWYAPSQGGSIFSPESSMSGIAAFVAAAKYGPC